MKTFSEGDIVRLYGPITNPLARHEDEWILVPQDVRGRVVGRSTTSPRWTVAFDNGYLKAMHYASIAKVPPLILLAECAEGDE